MDQYIYGLQNAADPSIAYRALRRLEETPSDDRLQRQQRRVVDTSNAQRLLSHRQLDGTIRLGNEYHAYRKFQGAHWTLAALAELGYPPGDPSLMPIVNQIHQWLSHPKHLRPPATEVISRQGDRVRRCASQEGLAIWYLHELGLVDERVDVLVSRLIDYQWPDGGWNCDKNPSARTSSVQETLLPLRGLARHLEAGTREPAIIGAVDAAAEFFLERRLLWRHRDGVPIKPSWGRDPMLIQWPIRLYDILLSLVVMAELGRIKDPRCADALGVLAGKHLKSGGFPVEARTANTVDKVASRGTFADWGPSGRNQPNPFVSIDAAWVFSRVSTPKAPGPSSETGALLAF